MRKKIIFLFTLILWNSANAETHNDTLWARVTFKIVNQYGKGVENGYVLLRDTANSQHTYVASNDTIEIPADFAFRISATASEYDAAISSQSIIRIKPHAELKNTVYRYTITIRIVEFPDILFASGSAELTKSEKSKLDCMIQFYKDTLDQGRFDWGFVVKGYTDSVGTQESNMNLSRHRADNVMKYIERRVAVAADSYLVLMNICCVKYYGEQNPVASNSSAEGRQHNRRVTVAFRKDVFIRTSIGQDPCVE